MERLGTRATAQAARELLVRQADFARSKGEVEQLLHTRGHGLSEELFRAWRKAIRSGSMPPATDAPSAAFAACWDAAQEQARAEERLIGALDQELARARTALLDSSRTLLPPYLIFGVGGVRELLPKLLAPPAADEAPA
ncbi:MAG TPA: hypothetical protein VF551_08030, partial [Chthoniobacterales bacterium]